MHASAPLYQVDAFSSEPFGGNPAAVCLVEQWAEDERLQSFAAEMNLSETAFLKSKGENHYELRWFTPAVEVDLCGHATLASAHVLWSEKQAIVGEPIQFDSRSGRLIANRRNDLIELDFPAKPAEPAAAAEGLLESLGVANPLQVSRNQFDWLVELVDEESVRGLQPDFVSLGKLPDRGVIVTARAGAEREYDFVSRFFAPTVGIDEDPVTGSAHCCLSPYWTSRLGRERLVGFQASQRGGLVQTKLEADRVVLGGRAVTIFRGEVC